MRRMLGTTTALSMAMFNVQPWPLHAQTLTKTGAVVAVDGTVLCEPTADAACDPAAFIDQANAIAARIAEAAAQAEADAAAAAQVEADAAAAAQADAAAAAAAQAEADAAAAAAQAEADAKAQADAEAAAQADADAKAAADAAAQAEADAKAAVDAAAAEADANAEAAAQADADAKAAADAAVAAQTEADAKAAANADEAAQTDADADAAPDADAAANADAAAKAELKAKIRAKVKAKKAKEKADADAAAESAPVEEAIKAAPADDPNAVPMDTTTEAAPADPATEKVAPADASNEPAPVEGTDPDAADAAGTDEPVVLPATVTDPATGETLVVDPATGAAMSEEEAAAQAAAQEKSLAEAQKEIAVEADGSVVDPSAGLKTAPPVMNPDTPPVDVPVASEAEVETLTNLLAQPEGIDPASLGAAAALATTVATAEGEKPSDQAPPADAVATVTEMLTDDSVRSSKQEFAAAPVAVGSDKKKKSGLSDLEKVGLVALGALVVGAIIKDNNKDRRGREGSQVVSNTGDRVVVLKPDGTYQVYKDDDAVLRQPGSNVRTETYKDGSTRSIVERADGTQIVTIRDASGRVLRRAQYDERGRELVLINDLEPEQVVIVRDLPKPRENRVVISAKDNDYALKAALAAKDIEKIGRTFSLRQIREIPQVRWLAATIDVDNVNFASGSSAITADEATDLADLGSVMQEMLDANPGEIFLIEGHTDATGKAAMNLALSDRRAESVALALTEYFDIPPENMVIQGYGETELRIDTQADEKRNRRVAVRIITPLLTVGK
ncbi:OmpA family protein [Cypionkella sp.]|uniref:OmpA family protein n=1 Tax=Cypionkella sp. TaxID=2811411 RepID=UPI002ABB1529|nr:OmpA family protein [Cypionkella sp.]MDZ4393596.1 OmpA family protein [Cypionkella sp.]